MQSKKIDVVMVQNGFFKGYFRADEEIPDYLHTDYFRITKMLMEESEFENKKKKNNVCRFYKRKG